MAKITGPTVGATSTQVAEDNPRRRRIVLCNNSDEDMYVAPGALAVSTQGMPVNAGGGVWDDGPDNQGYVYTGIYTAVCVSGGKVLSVTEWSY